MSLISITFSKPFQSMPNMRDTTRRKESEIMICCCYYYPRLHSNFFYGYSISINELRNKNSEMKDCDHRSGGVSKTEENNIKCNIFNEKSLIFLFDVPSDETPKIKKEKLTQGTVHELRHRFKFSTEMSSYFIAPGSVAAD